jgi:alpha-beta hydrolase superfamily lysophospholipase
MQSTTTTVTATDGTALHTHRWLPERTPKGVVQIAHGVSEHSGRYSRLAEALTVAGYAVYAADHRGHGSTGVEADRGYFADRDGWSTIVGDLRAVSRLGHEEHPGLPVFLLGHSMGSFLARSYAIEDSRDLAGLVLSGTAGDPGLLGRGGLAIAKALAVVRGPRHVSQTLDKMSFSRFNSAFEPIRTKNDWLSRDDAEVDSYLEDPRCGDIPTVGLYMDMVRGLIAVNDNRKVVAVRRDLPVLLLSGDRCQVGENGKGPRAVRDQLVQAGVIDVTLTLYPEARHEIFNETNRDEVIGDLVAWLDAHLPA